MREKHRAAPPFARDRRFLPQMRGGARHAERTVRAAEADFARRAVRAAQARAEFAACHIAAPFRILSLGSIPQSKIQVKFLQKTS